MRRPGGYAITTSAAGQREVVEDTFTCGHCNSIVFVKPNEDPGAAGGFCRLCMKHICPTESCHAGCEPFERKMEALERKEKLWRRAMGL